MNRIQSIQCAVVVLALGAMLQGGPTPLRTAAAQDRFAGPQELLAQYGVAEAAWEELRQQESLAALEESEPFPRIMQQVSRWDAATVYAWLPDEGATDWRQVGENLERWQGKLVPLAGRVNRVEPQPLDEESAARFELPIVYRCELEVSGGSGGVILFTTRVPSVWPLAAVLNEPVEAAALVLGQTGDGEGSQLVLAAPRLAWYPEDAQPDWNINEGMVLLAGQGLDAGLRDNLVQRRPILAPERELFYQSLVAASRQEQSELAPLAAKQVSRSLPSWRDDAAKLEQDVRRLEELAATQPEDLDASELASLRQEWAAVRAQIAASQRGLDSVVDLFNRPAENFGRLVLLAGTARRAVAVEVYAPASGEVNRNANRDANRDIYERFGVERYYEVEFFPPDAQNNPVVVCTSTLPEGFPVGDAISEPIRVAGFFFKSWGYTSRRGGLAGDPPSGPPVQFAPLLVAGQIEWVRPPPPSSNATAGIIAGALFVAALGLVWWGVWRSYRSDRNATGRLAATTNETSPRAFLEELARQQAEQPPQSE